MVEVIEMVEAIVAGVVMGVAGEGEVVDEAALGTSSDAIFEYFEFEN